MPNKRAKIYKPPPSQKKAKLTPRIEAEGNTVLFSFQWFDSGRKWGSKAKHKFWAIADKLKSSEGRTWAQLSADRNDHYIGLDKFPTKTKKVIVKRGLDEFDGLWSLRITGGCRLWGVRWQESRYFMVVWWDPDHKAYPVNKRYT